MWHIKISLLIVLHLTLLQLVLSDPVPLNQTTPSIERNCKEVARVNLRSCIISHFLPENETQIMYNGSRCPICAHACSNSKAILECLNIAVDDNLPCNKNVRDVGTQFYRDLFNSSLTFFCDDGGDKLSTIDDDENMGCIVSKEGNCSVDVMNDKADEENKVESDGQSPSESNVFTPEMLCRRLTNGLVCVAKKAESCNQETATLIRSYVDHLKGSAPCSKSFVEI